MTYVGSVLGSGIIVISVLAVFIVFGTVNAYTAGFGRVVYAAAKEGDVLKSFVWGRFTSFN